MATKSREVMSDPGSDGTKCPACGSTDTRPYAWRTYVAISAAKNGKPAKTRAVETFGHVCYQCWNRWEAAR
jgi:RNA polymerase subunit RPABC4/transcription elongation factor Spt4